MPSQLDESVFRQVWNIFAERYEVSDVIEDEDISLGQRQRYNYLSLQWIEKHPSLMQLLGSDPKLRRAKEIRFGGLQAETVRICTQNRHPNFFWAEGQAQLSPGGAGLNLNWRPWCPTCGEVPWEEISIGF